MSITGGIKFFKASKNLYKDGASIAASTGNDSANYAIDRNSASYWRSVGTTDLTTETIELEFSESKTIDRILILDMNLKGFVVKYDASGVWTHFSGVTGIDGTKSNITETAFTDNSAYYEFTSVTTTKIQIEMTTTQVVDAEKYISQIICTEEIGTLVGYPEIDGLTFDKNNRVKQTLSGRYSIIKSDEASEFKLKFKNYPANTVYSPDVDIMMSLHDSDDDFIVWLCGGRRGSSYFKYTLRGFRLKDAITMQISKEIKVEYTSNIYTSTLNMQVDFKEVI